MSLFMRSLAALCLAAFYTSAASAADRVIIVLDASGSMWGQIDGKPKLEIARQSLRTVLQSVPGDREIGLMAYGHRDKNSCQDIELIVPPRAGSAGAIASAADSMKFLGKTPLTDAVKQAAEALKYTEDKATVVLITDGLETCEGDPCALGRELEAAGVDFTVNVVGFGLTDAEGKQVACLAESTGGKYIQASDEKSLQQALAETVSAPKQAPSTPPASSPAPAPASESAPAPEPVPEAQKPEFNFLPTTVFSAGGDPVTDGNAYEIYKAKDDGSQGEYLTTEYGAYKGDLDPGDYLVVARNGEAKVEQKLKVEPGQVYKQVFVLNAGTLVIRPRASQGAEINVSARVDFAYPGGTTTTYGETKIVVPAGEQKVTVGIGQGNATETVQLAAGQTVEKDIVVGVGRVVINAFYALGGDKIEMPGLAFQIVKAQKKTDGTRQDVEHSYGPDSTFDLPAGDYVAVATADLASVEQPFNIRVGETKEVEVDMNAGVLSISAPGAYSIEIVAAKKDIQGNRTSLGLNYGDKWNQTMKAGDYVVIRHQPDNGGERERPVTVRPGGRAEITVQ
ncbi:hypothetical protein ASD44_17670 [Mesorhizobium sp. Root554]|nr:hypothetical protein ASD27_17675 [Mesorhizobium sp. Root1471]KQZ38181.1 hypothetical protein ASD44_17670 [Mesorhizobium sp. Root554]